MNELLEKALDAHGGLDRWTRRRVYKRDDKMMPMQDKLMVSIDISNVRFR
jgi:hypothetical protein